MIATRARMAAAPVAAGGGGVPDPPPGTPLMYFDAALETFQDTAATTVAAANDPVRLWRDQSGNGHHLDAGFDSLRPTLIAGAVNGWPVLRFDGLDDRLNTSVISAVSQPNTVIIVGEMRSASGLDSRFTSGMSTSNRVEIGSGAGNGIRVSGGTTLTVGTITKSAPIILSVLFNGASSQVWQNGAAAGTGNAGADSLTGLYLGGSSAGTARLPGDIALLLVYPDALTNTEREDVESYLATRFGITI